MPFSPVPSESKNRIKKAGQILVRNYLGEEIQVEDLNCAYDLANRWRACHAYPINTFQSLLRRKINSGIYPGEPFASQRLKRMPTIIAKLVRFPNMNLTTMQDIGGVRAVLNSIEDVYRLRDEYINCSFEHHLVQEMDHISNPRDEDGYRSVHLIYRYQNYRKPNYDGLKLELQIRTKLQHLWATAVETMGTILGEALKSRQGSVEWQDFFALISNAFAIKEQTTRLGRFSQLTNEELINELRKKNDEINALPKMSTFSAVVSLMKNEKGYSYHLLVLDSLNRKTYIQSFNRDSYEIAVDAYELIEKKAINGEKLEPVLVSAGNLETVKKAYPSFFLEISDFLKILRAILDNKYL